MSTAPPAPAPPTPDHRQWPLYWFAQLEGALEDGDLGRAAEAQAQLERLGLRVEPIAPWQEGGTGSVE